jgi:uncharacterized protein YegL
MDGSGSINSCGFNNGKKAIKSLMLYKQAGIHAKYATVTFATQAKVNFNFLPREKAAEKISSIRHYGGGTNTQAGLAEALKLFKKGKRNNYGVTIKLNSISGYKMDKNLKQPFLKGYSPGVGITTPLNGSKLPC